MRTVRVFLTITMPKRKCYFNDELKKDFPFLIEQKETNMLLCSICKSVFSIVHGGRSDILQHASMKKHKLAEVSRISSQNIQSFFVNKNLTNDVKRIAAEEGMLAFHTVKHNHSFRSMDCTSSIIRRFYEKKLTCSRTKCESIVVNVLVPFAMQQLCKELKEAKYMSVMVDTSNHKNVKLVPILVRYFTPNKGIQVKVIEFQNISCESAESLSQFILKVLSKYDLEEKIVAFCGDNCNTNFGGVARKGSNNVFSKLKSVLDIDIFGIGCVAHIIHNGVQTSCDQLPIDIEVIVNKIFQFFHIYAVRVEELKNFCNFAETEYKQVLGSVKTRWLSLEVAVTRIIDMYAGLKSYFLSQQKCPRILKSFFEDPQSFFWLLFAQSQLKIFTSTIKEIEGENICGNEVLDELKSLCEKVKNRKEEHFKTLKVKSLLMELEEEGVISEKQYEDISNNFYDTFTEYLEKWSGPMKLLEPFQWIQLKTAPTWKEVQDSLQCISNIDKKFLSTVIEEELFDEVNHVKNVFDKKKVNGQLTQNLVKNGVTYSQPLVV